MPYTYHKFFDGVVCAAEVLDQTKCGDHRHEYLEFVYVMDGSAEHHINGKPGVLGAGDYFVVDYTATHDYESAAGDLNIVNCMFLPELIDPSFAGVRSFEDLAERYFFRIAGRRISGPAANQVFHDADGTVRHLFEQLVREHTDRRDGYQEMMKQLVEQVIVHTVRRVGSERRYSEPVIRLMATLDSRYRERLSLADLCREMHYSVPYVSGRFREETGMTFTEYLQSRRMEEGCRLLENEQMTVEAVADAVGYRNVKFFEKVFREIINMTPREYRKSCSR